MSENTKDFILTLWAEYAENGDSPSTAAQRMLQLYPDRLRPFKTLKQIRDVILNTEQNTTGQRPKRKEMKRLYTPHDAVEPLQVVQCDIADFRKYQINGVPPHRVRDPYVLIGVDVFSRYAWIETIRRRTQNEDNLAGAFDQLLKRMRHDAKERSIKLIIADNEFQGTMREIAAKHGARLINSVPGERGRDPMKNMTSIVERFIKTLRTAIGRMLSRGSGNADRQLYQRIVENYNRTQHRSINTEPLAALQTRSTAGRTGEKREEQIRKVPDLFLPRGMEVSYSLMKKKFEKEGEPKWTNYNYEIAARLRNNQYLLKNKDNNEYLDLHIPRYRLRYRPKDKHNAIGETLKVKRRLPPPMKKLKAKPSQGARPKPAQPQQPGATKRIAQRFQTQRHQPHKQQQARPKPAQQQRARPKPAQPQQARPKPTQVSRAQPKRNTKNSYRMLKRAAAQHKRTTRDIARRLRQPQPPQRRRTNQQIQPQPEPPQTPPPARIRQPETPRAARGVNPDTNSKTSQVPREAPRSRKEALAASRKRRAIRNRMKKRGETIPEAVISNGYSN